MKKKSEFIEKKKQTLESYWMSSQFRTKFFKKPVFLNCLQKEGIFKKL